MNRCHSGYGLSFYLRFVLSTYSHDLWVFEAWPTPSRLTFSNFENLLNQIIQFDTKLGFMIQLNPLNYIIEKPNWTSIKFIVYKSVGAPTNTHTHTHTFHSLSCTYISSLATSFKVHWNSKSYKPII